MRINNNLMAMSTHRSLGIIARNSAKSVEKLSSGVRLNKAGDDAAGLAISEKMRTQVRGLNQASRNAQDAISLIQTAEGASGEIHDILQRMRELAVQSASDTNTDEDRVIIDNEVVQLKQGINHIAHNTEFNTKKILNSASVIPDCTLGNSNKEVVDVLNAKVPSWINDAMVAINTRFAISHPNFPIQRPMQVEYIRAGSSSYGAAMGTVDGLNLTMRINLDVVAPGGVLLSDDVLDGLIAHEMMHSYQLIKMTDLRSLGISKAEKWFMEGLSMLTQGGNGFITALGSIANPQSAMVDLVGGFDNSTADYASAYVALKTLHEITVGGINMVINWLESGFSLNDAIQFTTQQNQGEVMVGVLNYNTFSDFIAEFNANNFDAYLSASTDFTQGTGAIVTGGIAGSSSNLDLASTITNETGTTLVYKHFSLNFSQEPTIESIVATPDHFLFQIGANGNQNMELTTQNLTSNGLGLDSISLTSQISSNTAITTINAAIGSVSNVRSYFGALQNRLEYTIKNLDTSAENLQASESRIRDVDMAKEMMNFTKNNILQQAAQAMLAQANQSPNGVLQLLR